MMNDLFDENNENKLSADESGNSSVSLDDRKEQLEDKISREMNAEKPMSSSPVILKKSDEVSPQAETRSPYDRPSAEYKENRINNNPVQNNGLPELNENFVKSGSSFNNPYYSSVPYGNAMVKDYTGGVPLYPQKPKMAKIDSSLKSYMIIIVSITVIFLLGFIFECVRSYRDNGIFGGENGIFSDDSLNEYFDTDYDFGFNFGEKDTDDDNIFEFNNDNGSDKDEEPLTEAPDKNSVINKSAANITAKDQPRDIDSAEYTAKKAFKRVENSVVNVVVYNGDIGNEDLATGSGSGIIISDDGYIVTNSHVINDSKEYGVEIITTDGTAYVATIVGFDARTDLAVLKIDAEGLSAVEFVDSDQIEVGQDAIAVGNPGGIDYSNSLTRGCVSALNRTLSSNKLVSYIQTDAAINPGNSGGPLLNSAGQVMGINTIKISNSDYEGMGFAIPSNTVIKIANDLIGQGYISGRVRLGITGREVSYGIMSDSPEGIIIDEFSDDSPFNGTDVKNGDIITGIDGNSIKTFAELFSELDKYNPGDEVFITIYRSSTGTVKGKTFEVKIKLIADNGETQNK